MLSSIPTPREEVSGDNHRHSCALKNDMDQNKAGEGKVWPSSGEAYFKSRTMGK